MPNFEYKVVPAPLKADKPRGVKGTQARYAHTLMSLMNELGRDGWEYQRADSLPCEERQGLTGRTTTFQNVLIFRRALTEDTAPEPKEPHTPEEILSSAVASLEVERPKVDAPSVVSAPAGKAPNISPAEAQAPAAKFRSGLAAE